MREWWDSYPDHEHVKDNTAVTSEQIQRLRANKAAAEERATGIPRETSSSFPVHSQYRTLEKTHESAEMLGRGKPYGWKPE